MIAKRRLSKRDPEFKRLRNYDFADAKAASTFPHLVKHHLERLHQLTVKIDDDLVQWLANDMPPEEYARIMNSALREFRKKRAA